MVKVYETATAVVHSAKRSSKALNTRATRVQYICIDYFKGPYTWIINFANNDIICQFFVLFAKNVHNN